MQPGRPTNHVFTARVTYGGPDRFDVTMDGPAYATLRAPRGSLGCAFGGMARAEEP